MTDRMGSLRRPRLVHAGPAPTPTGGRAGDRAPLLAKVHIARKDMALTEDSYRDVLRRLTGHESAAALDVAGLEDVLREFRRLGWKGKARKPEGTPQQRMIHAVWRDIVPHLDHVADRAGADEALRAFVERTTGVAAVRFLRGEDASRVIEGLKAWRTRVRRQQAAEVVA